MSLRPIAFALIVLTALVAIVGDWAGDAAAIRWWCVPAALLLLALAYDRWQLRRTRIGLQVRAPPQWLLGRPSVVVLELAHHGARAVPIEIALDAPPGIACQRELRALTLPPTVATRLELRAVPQRLGRFVWPALRARASGPLGFAWWPLRLGDAVSVQVMPDLLGRANVGAGATAGGDRAGVQRGTGSELLQLRGAQPDEPLRAIDWKATARRHTLIARDYTDDQHVEIIVAIDAGRGSGVWCGELDRLGHYVNVTARLAEHAVAQDDRVGVVVFGDRPLAALRPDHGRRAVSRLRTLLSAIRVQATDSNPIHAAARIRTLVRRRCLAIVLTEIDAAASSSQLATAVRLLRPMHLPLIVGIKSATLDNFARAPDGDWLDPYRALAAEENRVLQARNLAALQALAATALLVRPEQLEQAVYAAYARFRRQRRV